MLPLIRVSIFTRTCPSKCPQPMVKSEWGGCFWGVGTISFAAAPVTVLVIMVIMLMWLREAVGPRYKYVLIGQMLVLLLLQKKKIEGFFSQWSDADVELLLDLVLIWSPLMSLKKFHVLVDFVVSWFSREEWKKSFKTFFPSFSPFCCAKRNHSWSPAAHQHQYLTAVTDKLSMSSFCTA